jgi:NAD(P)H-hydrate epimerase
LAGDLAAQVLGEDGLVAGDIMKYMPSALKMMRTQFNKISRNFYNSIFLL